MNSETAKILRAGSAMLGKSLIGRGDKREDVDALLPLLLEERDKAVVGSLASGALIQVTECLQHAMKEGSVRAYQASQALQAADAALVDIGEPAVTLFEQATRPKCR